MKKLSLIHLGSLEKQSKSKDKILVILGPTATGKTDLALTLAHKFNGELVSCDSRQLYQGLDIGTGKLPSKKVEYQTGKGRWVVGGVNIWNYDLTDPKTQFTVKDYLTHSEKVIGDILNRGALPIIVGGTGLYLKALLTGLDNLSIPDNPKLRGELSKLTLIQLQEKLKQLSLKKWESLNNSDQNNPRRLTRSIELHMNPYIKTNISKIDTKNWDILKIGLTGSTEVLKKNISNRLLSRLKQGMVEEAEKLNLEGLSLTRMRELGLEYRYLADYLEKIIDKAQLISLLNTKIYQYAKRQLTWFKKESKVNWFDITAKNYQSEVEKLVVNWYHLDINE